MLIDTSRAPSIHLPASQDFPSLRILDLSFNALPSLRAALASLAPLGGLTGGLQQLRLNDNPLSSGAQQPGEPRQVHVGGHDPAGAAAWAKYRQGILQVLPRLRELDSQPISDAERQQHLQAAAKRGIGAAAGGAVLPAADAVGDGAGTDRQARTVLWLLTQPSALELMQQSDAQQQALATASFLSRLSGQPAAAPGSKGTAAALAALEQAAACGSSTGQQGGSATKAAALNGASGSVAAQPQQLLRRSQQLYLLLARDETGAAEDLLWLNPEHYRELLGRLHNAATRIQAAWRRLRAIRLRQRLAAEQHASRQAAAAACVQAAWRGWVCRQRTYAAVQDRLLEWRRQWREAQQLVAEHQRSCAAVLIQVRG